MNYIEISTRITATKIEKGKIGLAFIPSLDSGLDPSSEIYVALVFHMETIARTYPAGGRSYELPRPESVELYPVLRSG